MTEKGSKLIHKIAAFSKNYEDECCSEKTLKENHVNLSKVQSDWWEALKYFLFCHAFYQGRRDEVSEKVANLAYNVTSGYFRSKQDREANFRELKSKAWSPLTDALKGVIGKGKIGKGRDIEMVISTLNFISKLPDKNIVRYSCERIISGETKSLYYELQKSENDHGIISVGPKVASFFLRDLITVLHLKDKVSEEDLIFMQPVDTWVKQIAEVLDIRAKDVWAAREQIMKMCTSEGVSPVEFNEGAWYIGKHSLDILLNQLIDN